MVTLYDSGAYLLNGRELIADGADASQIITAKTGQVIAKADAVKQTMAYGILEKHNTSGNMDSLKIRFDCMASHDITYVGIIQTARASGLEKFPMPYVLTNCHNSLCAVGGTINEDDHLFGLSAAQKYGGIYVPAHQAVIHQYMREMMSGTGKMILGSDSHTRYGALGTMAIGEGGGELAKQLLCKTYDVDRPGVVCVYLTGKPQIGVGPQDVALAIIGAVFDNGYVKNKVMEFVGDGIANLNVEYRNGIDVMTTETTCLSSIWMTDEKVADYYAAHGRKEAYAKLAPGDAAYYDGAIVVALDKVKPMIAMPFHPSNVYTIEELNANLLDVLNKVEKTAAEQLGKAGERFTLHDKVKNGKFCMEQGVIAGCAGGTFDNICDAADMLRGQTIGDGEFTLSVYPSSQPTFLSLVENGAVATLMTAGATVRSAFCGPCFGAGDVPANNTLSIRHTTRNFPNREGSKPSSGQIASVALMDARSIAATAVNKGVLTAATDMDLSFTKPAYYFNADIYKNRCYDGYGRPDAAVALKYGPGITDWPAMPALAENFLLQAASVIHDPVTTTDELIPSGETSSYRSNPLGLAEFTLSRKDPQYVSRAKAIHAAETARLANEDAFAAVPGLKAVFAEAQAIAPGATIQNTGVGSVVYAVKPGDGSAREQAASCQKVLGGYANIAREYATKRYRSNLINWGIVPFLMAADADFAPEDYIFIPHVRKAVETRQKEIPAYVLGKNAKQLVLTIADLTDDEIQIILSGCLINYYR